MDASAHEVDDIPADPREDVALQLTEDKRPEKRFRGLRLLQRL